MVSRERRRPGRSSADDQSAVLQVRLPAHRLDQLMLLADRNGILATTMARDLVLDHLDQLDPEGEFLAVGPAQSPCGGSLASVSRLPVMSGMTEMPAVVREAGVASVTPLREPVRPGNGSR